MDTPDYPHILTKENFWNELHEKYPNQMKVFCDWIDEYKKRVKWGKLFNEFLDCDVIDNINAPKFHEIPVAIQIGIFIQFTCEQNDCMVCEHPIWDMKELIDVMRRWMAKREGGDVTPLKLQ